MNSYMSPQGARCTASPRVTTATRWASAPAALHATAARTHGPASHADLKAPAGRAGAGPPPCGAAVAGLTPGSPGPDGSAAEPEPAAAAPTAASWATSAGLGALAATRRGRPKA